MKPLLSLTPERWDWGLLASFALHALLLAGLAVSPAVRRVARSNEEGVAVDFLSARQFAALTGADREAPPVAPSIPQDQPQSRPSPQTQQGLIRATTMLSAKALADPKSRDAREVLATLADSERAVQICNLEAMEQVRAWRPDYRPERIVAYAMAEVAVEGSTIAADGAAFRSGGAWYNLKFRCDLTPDGGKVAAFAFKVGDPIPADQWEAHSLAAVH